MTFELSALKRPPRRHICAYVNYTFLLFLIHVFIYPHAILNLDSAFERKHAIFVFLWLAYFVKFGDYFRFCPFPCKGHNFNFLCGSIAFWPQTPVPLLLASRVLTCSLPNREIEATVSMETSLPRLYPELLVATRLASQLALGIYLFPAAHLSTAAKHRGMSHRAWILRAFWGPKCTSSRFRSQHFIHISPATLTNISKRLTLSSRKIHK